MWMVIFGVHGVVWGLLFTSAACRGMSELPNFGLSPISKTVTAPSADGIAFETPSTAERAFRTFPDLRAYPRVDFTGDLV